MVPEGIAIEQIDDAVGGTLIKDSSWATLTITVPGTPDARYVNFVASGTWVLQNMILAGQAPEETAMRSVRFSFDLGVDDGTDVTSLDCAYEISATPRDTPPVDQFTAAVGSSEIAIFDSNIALDDPDHTFTGEFPALRAEDVPFDQPARHDSSFPNQEAGQNDCGGAAVSNSLQFLKAKHQLPINDEDLSISAVRAAMSTPGNTWWDNKDSYLFSKGVTNVKTERAQTWLEVWKNLQAGADIEIAFKFDNRPVGHAVAIVEITLRRNGTVEIKVAHDGDQTKNPGGTTIDTLVMDGERCITPHWEGGMTNVVMENVIGN